MTPSPEDVERMIETVARAICVAYGKDPDEPVQAGGMEWPLWHESLIVARAAIGALTPDMLAALSAIGGDE